MAAIKKASEVADLLDLRPHPEGGYYSETFRDSSITLSKSLLPSQYKVDRPVSTSIYFLLPSGNISHLHRIPCAETWHFYMGEPLTEAPSQLKRLLVYYQDCPNLKDHTYQKEVFELHDDGHIELTVLGTDLDAGHRPQYTVPPNVWFGSFPTLDVTSFSSDGSVLVKAPKRDAEFHYSLVGCTCAPAFQFEDFELAALSDVVLLAPKAEPFLKYLTQWSSN